MKETNRLGQLLIERSWATPDAVIRALRMQRSAPGDYLGTSLLEIGAVSEETLVRALAELHRVPAATAEDLRSIPQETVGLVPAQLARRCKAIPFRAWGTQVDLAVRDPRDLGCQDEIAFAVGRRLRIHVAAEVRIAEALERYYGEPTTSRMGILIERLNRTKYLWRPGTDLERGSGEVDALDRGESDPLTVAAPPLPPARLPATPPSVPLETPPPPLGGVAGDPASRTTERSAPPARFAPDPPTTDVRPAGQVDTPLELPLYDERLDAPAATTSSAGTPAPVAGDPAVAAAAPANERLEFSDLQPLRLEDDPEGGEEKEDAKPAAPRTVPVLDATLEELAACDDPEAIGELLLDHLGPHFLRVALFRVRRGRVEGWRGRGERLDSECLRSFSAELDEPSLFQNLHGGGAFFVGPPPALPAHRRFSHCLGGEDPAECLLLPVRVREKLATIVYADRGSRPLDRLDLDALQRLAAAAGDAYTRAILQRKKD